MGKNNRRRNNKKKNAASSNASASSTQAKATPVVEVQHDDKVMEDNINITTIQENNADSKENETSKGDVTEDPQLTDKAYDGNVTSRECSGEAGSIGQVETVQQHSEGSTSVDEKNETESENGGHIVDADRVVGDLCDNVDVQSVGDTADVNVDKSSIRDDCAMVEATPPCETECTHSMGDCDGNDEEEEEDNDDASLSDLVNHDQEMCEDEDYVAVSTTNSEDQNKENDSDSPNSNSSYVMVAEDEEEEEQHQWVDPLSLPPTSPAAHQYDEYEDTESNQDILCSNIKDSNEDGGKDEADDDDVEYNVQAQLREANYVEEDEEDFYEDDILHTQVGGGDGYYPDDFEDEDGMVEDEGRAIQKHLQEMQKQQNNDDIDNDSDDNDAKEGRQFLSLEPRVAIAVALKVVNILRKNKVLDGRSSGQVKDKIFGGDKDVLHAVEEFTTTQSVERLVSVIHNLSL